MRHATDVDLDQLEGLLLRLRCMPELRERKRGSFSRGSRGFVHFHADADDFFADVRLDSAYQRVRVTSEADQDRFLSLVRDSLG